MKIGFLTIFFYPLKGGAENNCYYLAKELAKTNEVHIFCSGDKDIDEVIDNMHVHRSKEIFRYGLYFSLYPSVTNKILNYDLDVLHVIGFGVLQNDLSLLKIKRKKPNLKIVCTPHGPFMALKKYNLVGTIYKNLYTPFIKKFIKKYEIVFEVNPFQKEWITKDYGIEESKIKFLPNGIPNESFVKISKDYNKKLIEKYDLKNKFVISFIGRLQAYKGIGQIIEVLPRLKIENPNIMFLAIGRDAGDKAAFEKKAEELGVKENIIFTGEVDDKDKLGLLDISEIFIFPSEWEAFGIVVLEAMTRKNAIVSTKTEGGLYLVKDGENGFLFDYLDTETLFKKIALIMKDKKLKNKIQKNNFEKSKKFLWQDIAKDLGDYYKEILKNNPK